ncbi:hypothetical protein V1478_002699 [Vespula squamosa]|uniref:Uncharacterized protein n=1 Tax=Vespula squamosa TaxID=30214 RepID=A0ABD2BTV8_VESSQ
MHGWLLPDATIFVTTLLSIEKSTRSRLVPRSLYLSLSSKKNERDINRRDRNNSEITSVISRMVVRGKLRYSLRLVAALAWRYNKRMLQIRLIAEETLLGGSLRIPHSLVYAASIADIASSPSAHKICRSSLATLVTFRTPNSELASTPETKEKAYTGRYQRRSGRLPNTSESFSLRDAVPACIDIDHRRDGRLILFRYSPSSLLKPTITFEFAPSSFNGKGFCEPNDLV